MRVTGGIDSLVRAKNNASQVENVSSELVFCGRFRRQVCRCV